MWRIEGMIWMRKIRMRTSSCRLLEKPYDLGRTTCTLIMGCIGCTPNPERERERGGTESAVIGGGRRCLLACVGWSSRLYSGRLFHTEELPAIILSATDEPEHTLCAHTADHFSPPFSTRHISRFVPDPTRRCLGPASV